MRIIQDMLDAGYRVWFYLRDQETENRFVEEINEVMTKKRTRDFPILDTKGKYRGMISRRNLLDMKKKQLQEQ